MTGRVKYLLLGMILLAACTKEQAAWDGPVIEFTLRCNDPVETKAIIPDPIIPEGANFNEDLISWVDFFFYPGGKTSSNATYHVRVESGKTVSDVFRLEFTSEEMNTLIFPTAPVDTRTATVFALANCPASLLEGLSNASLDRLYSVVASSDFLTPDYHKQERFLMSGTTTITLTGRSQAMAASGNIGLERYAAKLTVGINVQKQVKFRDTTNHVDVIWKPMLTGMEVYLVDGVSNVSLGGEAPEPQYFSYRNNPMRFVDDQGRLYVDMEGEYYQSYPTYMYPQHWTYGSTVSPEKEPYLKLVLPWVRQEDEENEISSTQKQFYYKIMIPDDARANFQRRFARNNWYHINIDVGILGAETDDAPIPLKTGLCYVVHWQDKDVVMKHAEIGSARYLSMERLHYELYNTNSVEMLLTTSHPVSIENIRATRPFYGTSGAGTNTKGGTVRVAGPEDIYPEGSKYLDYSAKQRKDKNGGVEWLSVQGDYIEFNHKLNNNYTSDTFDYSPYTVSFTVVHADRPEDPQYRQEVSLVQYPGIYIDYTANTDTFNQVGDKIIPEHWGYVYVDNEQWTLSSYNDSLPGKDNAWRQDHMWRVVNYSSGGTDMYDIHVSVLPEGSEFVLGDPRVDEVNNLRAPGDYFNEGPAIEGGTRSLTWYYPTEESSRTVNMIAPAYRVSTKLSGIEFDGISLQKARERCASFQENGFPAGRWRLPTRGEIRFISRLSNNGTFEWQFGGKYWSANGAVNVNKNGGAVTDVVPAPSIALLRCVYDSWYWGNDQVENLEQFTWADAER